MSNDQTQLEGATQRLDELRTFNILRVAQGESPPPVWLTTDEGERFIAALELGDVDEAVAIYAAARGRAFDEWMDLLWPACWPATREEGR